MAPRAYYIKVAWFFALPVKGQLLTNFDHLLKIYFHTRLGMKAKKGKKSTISISTEKAKRILFQLPLSSIHYVLPAVTISIERSSSLQLPRQVIVSLLAYTEIAFSGIN